MTPAHQTLAAIATAFAAGLPPQPGTPRRVDPAVEAALFAVGRACLACGDPYRALALAIGTLGQLQQDVSRSTKRPTKEREQAVAPPHRPKTKRRTERTIR